MSYLQTLFLTIASIFFSISSANADNRESQIIQYINQSSPSYFSLDRNSLKFQDFPGTNGGRISVIGNFTLTTDFVETNDGFSNLSQALQAKGYTVAEAREALKALNIFGSLGTVRLAELQVVHRRGDVFTFSGELPYLETVSGINISGRISSSRPKGRALNSIQGNFYVVGRPSFNEQLNRVAMVIDGMRSQESGFVAELRKALDDKMWFYDYENTGGDRRAREILDVTFNFDDKNFTYSSWSPVSIFKRCFGCATTPQGNGTVISGTAKATSQYKLGSGFTIEPGAEYPVDLTIGIPVGSDSVEDMVAILGLSAGNKRHQIGRLKRVPSQGTTDAYFETSFPNNGQALLTEDDFFPTPTRCTESRASIDSCERVHLKWWHTYKRALFPEPTCNVWNTFGNPDPFHEGFNKDTRVATYWSNALSGGKYGQTVEVYLLRVGETHGTTTC